MSEKCSEPDIELRCFDVSEVPPATQFYLPRWV